MKQLNTRGSARVQGHMGCGYIWNLEETDPYIDFKSNVKILSENSGKLKEAFLMATLRESVRTFTKNREHGVYIYGRAKAELTYNTHPDYNYVINVHTEVWEGIGDMQILKQKIFAGTILPAISYEREQKKGLLTVFKQLLAGKHLTKFQRFILALRMTTQRA